MTVISQTMTPLANTLCPLCGGANTCQPAQAGRFDVPCWCTTAIISKQALARVPAAVGDKACLCPGCAAGAGDQGEADISGR